MTRAQVLVGVNESDVLRACRQYLSLCGIFHFRCNVQGVPLHDGSGGYRKAPSKGIADIIGVIGDGNHDGWALAIEVKSARGRQSPAQREFQRQWQEAGGLYLLCRSVDELRKGLLAADVATYDRADARGPDE